jgi:hypothetical protein
LELSSIVNQHWQLLFCLKYSVLWPRKIKLNMCVQSHP